MTDEIPTQPYDASIKNKKNWKYLVDVFSAIFFLFPFYSYIWIWDDRSPLWPGHLSNMPLQVFLALLDAIPAVFGLSWLLVRYGRFLNNPILRDWRVLPFIWLTPLIVLLLLRHAVGK